MKKIALLLTLTITGFLSNLAFAQNVGVDVASPVEKLDVLGAIRIGNTSNTNAGAIRWNSPNFQGYDGTQWVNFGGGTLTGSGTATRVAFWSGTSSLSSSSNLYWDNTNSRLGIGTSSPSSVLDVINNSTAGYPTGDAKIRVKSNSTQSYGRFWAENDLGTFQMSGVAGSASLFSTHWNNAGFLFVSSAALGYFYHVNKSTGFHAFEIGQNNDNAENRTEIMRINLTGVGIGTTNPSSALEVAGQVKITGGTPGANKVLTSDAAGLATWVDPTTLVSNVWKLTGNASTVDGTNFIGTTDDKPLTIKVNNQKAGRIESGTWVGNNHANSFYGYLSGNAISSGSQNTAYGMQSLYSTSTGNDNTALGTYALYTNNGSRNTAIGLQALYTNGSANDNTSTGYGSLINNTDGSQNTANGSQAMQRNTLGNFNTASGYQSLMFSTTGNSNTAYGVAALYTNTTGSKNTALGSGADVTSVNLSNATAIGYNAKVATSNSLVLGGTGVDAVNVGIGTTAPGAKLEVAGQVKITGGTPAANQVLTSDATGLATWEPVPIGTVLQDADADTKVQVEESADEDIIRFDTFGAERMIIDNNGNVGIGSTNPGAKLDITGPANVSAGYYYGGTASPANVELTRTLGTTVGDVVEIGNFSVNQGAHNIRISVTVDNASFSVAKTYSITSNWNITGGIWQEVVPISNSGMYGGANDFVLDVRSPDNVTYIRLRRTNGSAAGTATVRIESVGKITDVFTETTATASGATVSGNYAPSVTGSYVQNQTVGNDFATGQNASFDIQSNAEIGGTLAVNTNIGIGSTTPTNPLEIVKAGGNSAMFRNTSSTNYSGMRFYNDQNSNVRSLEIDYSGSAYASSLMSSGGVTGEAGSIATTGAYPLMIGTSNTLRMIIEGGGNVGIGTNAPKASLSVAGNGLHLTGSGLSPSTGSGIELSGGTAPYLQAYNRTTPAYLPFRNIASYITFEPSGTEKVRINSSGLGIGVTPSYNFHSVTSATSGLQNFITNSGASFGGTVLKINATTPISSSWLLAVGSGSADDNTGTFSSKLVVQGDGNVGIGQSAPSATLDVVGTVEMFGAWTGRSANTVYQAATDGFIVSWAGSSYFRVKTDGSNPPTTTRMESEGAAANAARPNIMCPVRKGDYWKVETGSGNDPTVWWMPLGQ
jgi:hypothetical protein